MEDGGRPNSPLALHSTASMELELPLVAPVENAAMDDAMATPFAAAAASVPPGSPTAGDVDPLATERSSSFAARSASFTLRSIRRSGVEVFVWGAGDCGQLGDGATVDSAQPHRVEALAGKDVVGVAAGQLHTAVWTADGEVFSWGDNADGQLGIRGIDTAMAPVRIEALDNFKIDAAACGAGHTVVVAEDGTVLAFGQSDYGQLGIGKVEASRGDRPKTIKALVGTHIARVAAGGRHTLCLDARGTVYACGDGSSGAVGLSVGVHTEGEGSVDTPTPLMRMWPLGVSQIAAGDSHSAALTLGGALFTWGRGRSGQLGLGDFQNASTPSLVRALSATPLAQVACGGDHTMGITRNGEVFCWGLGKWGATGLGHNDNVCTPQRVGSLEGVRVVQAAAGGQHTLLLTEGNEVLGMGCNDNGQLGGEVGGAVLVPRKVEGLPAERSVLYVVAGGSHSVAVMHDGSSASGDSAGGGLQGARDGVLQASCVAPLQPMPLVALVQEAAARGKEDPGVLLQLSAAIEQTFVNPGFLLAAFLRQQAGGGGGPRDSSDQLDIPKIGEVYQTLLKLYDPSVVSALGASSVRLLDAIEKYLQSQHAQAPPKPRAPVNLDVALLPELAWVAPTLFILIQNPLAGDSGTYSTHIILRLGRILSATLPAPQRVPVRRALQALLVQLPGDALAARCVRPVQRYITHLVDTGRFGASRLEVMMAGVLLDVLLQANNEAGGKIPYSEFYNKALSAKADLQAEYLAWVRHRESSPNALTSFCQMPYLFTPEAKSHILHGEAMIQKEQHMSAAAMQAFFQGQNPSEAGFLRIAVRRTNVVEDALNALVVHADDLKKPLRVTFISGDVPEPAQDEGGVRKEFFQLLCRDLFRPDFGMFAFDDATRTYWFNPASLEAEEYGLVGALLGLAIYNSVLLDVHFPQVLYKKLLGGAPSFKDLKDGFPELGRGLQALLDYEPAADVEAVFCRSFDIEYEYWGEKKTQELKPGGTDIPVTGENRAEYVDMYTKWVLDDSIAPQFKAFAHGFLRVCGGPALTMFTPPELELLVCGLPHLDFAGLKDAARYEAGYDCDHPAVRWFWEIVDGMSLEQKRHFLMFTTGSDRAPVGGLGHLSVLIQRAGPDTDRLPTSHTCFNTLLLPEYASKSKMAERLLTAITNAQGFGLQ